MEKRQKVVKMWGKSVEKRKKVWENGGKMMEKGKNLLPHARLERERLLGLAGAGGCPGMTRAV